MSCKFVVFLSFLEVCELRNTHICPSDHLPTDSKCIYDDTSVFVYWFCIVCLTVLVLIVASVWQH